VESRGGRRAMLVLRSISSSCQHASTAVTVCDRSNDQENVPVAGHGSLQLHGLRKSSLQMALGTLRLKHTFVAQRPALWGMSSLKHTQIHTDACMYVYANTLHIHTRSYLGPQLQRPLRHAWQQGRHNRAG